MRSDTTLDDLRGLRTWSTAIRHWRIDGAEALAEFGLTWSGFDVLLALLEGPRRSGQLCNELGMTTGGMANLLKRLESTSIVERRRGEDADLRAVTVQLTAKGQALAEEAGTAIFEMRDVDFRQWDISQDFQEAVNEAWNRIGQSESAELSDRRTPAAAQNAPVNG